jgi:hypothetical protein
LEKFVPVVGKKCFKNSVDVGNEKNNNSCADPDDDFYELIIYDVEKYSDINQHKWNSDNNKSIDNKSCKEGCLEEEPFYC